MIQHAWMSACGALWLKKASRRFTPGSMTRREVQFLILITESSQQFLPVYKQKRMWCTTAHSTGLPHRLEAACWRSIADDTGRLQVLLQQPSRALYQIQQPKALCALSNQYLKRSDRSRPLTLLRHATRAPPVQFCRWDTRARGCNPRGSETSGRCTPRGTCTAVTVTVC